MPDTYTPEERKALRAWLKRRRDLFSGEVPKTRAQAKKRFTCKLLSGGPCTLDGFTCARRRRLAVARVEKEEAIEEGERSLDDDITCTMCVAGAARMALLFVRDAKSNTGESRKEEDDGISK